MTNHTVEVFAQDKWQMGDNTTLSLGLRYDLEIIPDVDPADNPLFAPGEKTTVDRNNFAPRIGFTRQLDDEGKSLVRAGYGIFYNRTMLGAIDDTIEFPKFTPSIVAMLPQRHRRPGPEPRAVPDRSVPGQRPVREPRAARPALSARVDAAQHRHGDLRCARTASSRTRIRSPSATCASWRRRWPCTSTTCAS